MESEVLVLCHGGPTATPGDALYTFERVRSLDGFYRASSMERLPTELAIRKQVNAFRQLRLGPAKKTIPRNPAQPHETHAT